MVSVCHHQRGSASCYATLWRLVSGSKTETNDTIYHLNQTISIVNRSLSYSPQFVQDSTIRAITCLALGGVCVAAPILGGDSVDCRVRIAGIRAYGEFTCVV